VHVLETEWWSLLLPPEWWAEEEGDSIVIGDRDGVGCLEVSELRHPDGVFDAAALRQLAAAQGSPVQSWRECRVGQLTGIAGDFLEEGAAIREWYLARGPLLLYVTYSCDEDDRGMDDAAVDEILGTLTVDPALS
jgi:hypothetical protein